MRGARSPSKLKGSDLRTASRLTAGGQVDWRQLEQGFGPWRSELEQVLKGELELREQFP